MQRANEKQIGGDHYRCKYQHWDFATKNHLDYLQGCATKYVSRWRKKNGIQDLKKSLHYVEKLSENFKERFGEKASIRELSLFQQFNELIDEETKIIGLICNYKTLKNLKEAEVRIKMLIQMEEAKQSKIDPTGQDSPFGVDKKSRH